MAFEPSAGIPFPIDFVAVCAVDHEVDVLRFEQARPAAAPRASPPLVLHAGLEPEALRVWEATGAVCADADRLLALLAPEEPPAPYASAADLGHRYVRAVRHIAPQSETLRLVAEVLPVACQAERAVLRHTLMRLVEATLGAALPQLPEAPRPPAPPPGGPLATPGWQAMPPHELLDLALAHLTAWRRGPGTPPFEPRREQAEMAHATLDALLRGRTLVVEAGTGTGKTIAYALPALLLAARTGSRCVLSTHTRNLQQQLVGRDLPELWACFGVPRLARPDGNGFGLQFAKLVGRSNYVCRTALRRQARQAIDAGGSFPVAQLLLWSLRTSSGELDELAGRRGFESRLLRDVASRRESCIGRGCRGGGDGDAGVCPVYTARDIARRADLVVVNHALLFSDSLSEGNILGRYDVLVVDECHNLVQVATENLRLALGRPQAEALAAPLARLRGDLLLLRGGEEAERLRRRLERYAERVRELSRGVHGLLDALDLGLQRGSGVRARQRYRDGDEVFGGVRESLEVLLGGLEAAAESGSALETECAAVALDEPRAEDLAPVLELLVHLQRETRLALEFLARGQDEEWAFYLDFGADGAGLREVGASPLDVAAEVQRLLAAPRRGTVYTSATLCVGESFEYVTGQIGIPAGAERLRLLSPFDYASQCLLLRVAHLDDYSEPAFESQVADILAEIARRVGRRTLVLLTAHAALRRLHGELLRRLGPRAPVLAQEISGSRERLAERFAQQESALLLGTNSFWEGVDFPGEALEVLAITKLPFLVPEEPLVAARSERLRRRGEDPFESYMLPEAVLRFKQGFGRLIRSRQDAGVVLLLDWRLGERSYGAEFLRALPAVPEVYSDSASLVERVVEWFAARSAKPEPLEGLQNEGDSRE